MVKIVGVDEEMRVSHTWRITSWSASRGFVLVLMVDGSGRRDGLLEALMMTNSHGNRFDPSLSSHRPLSFFPELDFWHSMLSEVLYWDLWGYFFRGTSVLVCPTITHSRAPLHARWVDPDPRKQNPRLVRMIYCTRQTHG